ncbi:MAG TPA: outer membrane beta-barrel family protein, partial [Chitinophagaceae bacterium]|nr:outer membrane beta-barrel family protein [Chitinophagaceae bacterium]
RIIRPNYQQLNPFLVFIDQYSYRTGNPYLNPAYNHYIEVSFRYKQFATISFQYDRMDDMFFNATQPVNTKFINRPENASIRSLAALMFNLNFPVTKWWKVNLNMGTGRFMTKGKVYNQSLDQSLYAYRVNALNQFTFPKGWSGELSSRYSSRIINLQRVYERRYQVNAGIQKKIMKGKGSVKLNAEDIFWSLKQSDRITGLNQTDVNHINFQDTRRMGIAVNFNFGKETFARKRRYNDNGADDIKGRVD